MDSLAGRFESELSLPALVVSMAGRFESEPLPANLDQDSLTGSVDDLRRDWTKDKTVYTLTIK